MIFFVRKGDQEHTVRVENRNQKLLVRFDDEPEQEVDLHFSGNQCSFIEEAKVFSASVVTQKGQATVWNPQGNMHFEVESEYRRITSLLRGQDIASESNVYAKMPGKIVKIAVKEGDAVEKGSPLMVMEAMKMENEIRSTLAGTVAAVSVKEGQAVETGALLVELAVADQG